MPEPTPFDQSTYQVRLDWGVDGLARLAPADVVVIVDVLLSSTRAALAADDDGAAIAAAAAQSGAPGALVLAGGFVNASAVAAAILAEQHRRGARTSVSVIAAGAGHPAGSAARFAVEDLLAAGAVIAALGEVGLDHGSPDAAAAAESYRALRRAVRHLVTASGSGRELAARGLAEEVAAAARIDVTDSVPVLNRA
ncbi:2-phosphosulfolactate phosphatase [Microbacterium sp. LRZ72]|uniref:2-phosphosulfolactate phosphatase n=1 Tax=Microbacterium sp. LRZ72 TaxID=2942481 RepID=UPI0029A544FB|nr:2-phosphosulfolactate phosphatase [Microbacterium sp. LRZ72]MDX2376653.1 2-phosphosulfolactate phosphatase [Microbacterium sp. LRZ72]